MFQNFASNYVWGILNNECFKIMIQNQASRKNAEESHIIIIYFTHILYFTYSYNHWFLLIWNIRWHGKQSLQLFMKNKAI